MHRFRVVGRGRAGGSIAAALVDAGWQEADALGRHDDLRGAASGVDLVILATPDAAIQATALLIEPVDETVVLHLAGSVGLGDLAPHVRRAALHPLVSLPSAALGAPKLRGAWFAVAGDPLARSLVDALGGRAFDVADEDRSAYHAAACIASNHLVALLAQVERIAASVGVPFEAYLALSSGTIDNVAELGPRNALTGPAARGDNETIDRHRAAIDPTELEPYEALSSAARRLAEGVE